MSLRFQRLILILLTLLMLGAALLLILFNTKQNIVFFYTPTELLENNIEPGKHFSKSLIWAQEFGYNSGDSNITEMIIKQVITLPIHKGINKNGIKKMAEIVNKYA